MNDIKYFGNVGKTWIFNPKIILFVMKSWDFEVGDGKELLIQNIHFLPPGERSSDLV